MRILSENSEQYLLKTFVDNGQIGSLYVVSAIVYVFWNDCLKILT